MSESNTVETRGNVVILFFRVVDFHEVLPCRKCFLVDGEACEAELLCARVLKPTRTTEFDEACLSPMPSNKFEAVTFIACPAMVSIST